MQRGCEGVRVRIWLAIVLVLAGMAGAAAAPSQEQMEFTVVRSAEDGCEPTCPEWIFAQGPITSQSDDRLKKLLRKLGKRRLPIIINSPGGDVDAAIAMGRAIRAAGLDIAVGATAFVRCAPSETKCQGNKGRGADYFGFAGSIGAYCNSACPLVLAGGAHRIAEPFASIGLHQVTTTFRKTKVLYQERYKTVNGRKKVISKKVLRRENAGSYKVYEMDKKIEGRLRAYLKEMGVDGYIVDIMKQTSADKIDFVSQVVAEANRLIEPDGKLNMLVGAQLCRSVPASSNCRLITTSDL